MSTKFNFSLSDNYNTRITDLNDTLKSISKWDFTGSEGDIPVGSKRINPTTYYLEEWDGSAWVDANINFGNNLTVSGVFYNAGNLLTTVSSGNLYHNIASGLDTDKSATRVQAISGGDSGIVFDANNGDFSGSDYAAVQQVRTTKDLRIDLYPNAFNAGGKIILGNYLSDYLTVSNTGKVGIGKTSTNDLIEVYSGGADDVYAVFQNGLSGSSNIDGMIVGIGGDALARVWSRDGNSLLFGTANVERMRITNTGLFGIGMIPENKFDIKAPSTQGTVFTIDHATKSEPTHSLGHSGNGPTYYQTYRNLTDGSIQSQFLVYTFDTGTHLRTTTNTPILFKTNNLYERLRITEDGKLSTGGETAPDIDAGGLCLNQGSGDGNILTFKSSDISHGMTSIVENNTYGRFRKVSSATGGMWISGYSEDVIGLELQGISINTDSTFTNLSRGTMTLNTGKKSGTGVTSNADSENIFVICNGSLAKFICKGDGDLYTDTGTITAYDAEEDIKLVETVRGIWDSKEVITKYKNRLEELGIMKNGFMSHNKMISLNLGAIGQIFNIIKNMAKELGYTETQLLEFAKEY